MRNVKLKVNDQELIPRILKDKEELCKEQDQELVQQSLISNIEDEKEFEKFIIQTSNSFINNDIESTQNAIVTMVRPLFNKLKQKEDNITDIMTKANVFSDYYQKTNDTLTEDTMRIKDKRNKLKYVCKELVDLKKRLMKREADLIKFEEENREAEELLEENEEIHQNNVLQFHKYIEEKSNELTIMANEITRLREENKAKDKELIVEEKEMSLREEKMHLIENEIKEKKQKVIEANDNMIYKKSKCNNKDLNDCLPFENYTAGGKSNYSITFNEQINAYSEYNNNNTKRQKEENSNSCKMHYSYNYTLQKHIEEKRRELEELNRQHSLLSNELQTKELDLANRLEIVDSRERGLNLQKEELYKKLHEVEARLEETKLLTSELKQKEAYINNYTINEKHLLKPDLNF